MFSHDRKLPRAFCTLQQDMPEVPLSKAAQAFHERFHSRSELLCGEQVWFHVPTGTPVRDGREEDNLRDSKLIHEQHPFLMDMRRADWRQRSTDYSDTDFWEKIWLSPVGLVLPSLSYHLSLQFKGVRGNVRIAEKSHWMMLAGWRGDPDLMLRFQFRRRQAKKSHQTILEFVEAWNERANSTTWPDGPVHLERIGCELIEDGFIYRLRQESSVQGGNVFPWLDLYYSIRLQLPEPDWPARVYWGKDDPARTGPPPFEIQP